MTIEQRLEQLELQNHRIERKNKRLTAALRLMAVAICAVVMMGMSSLRRDKVHGDANFDTVTARDIVVANEAGEILVALGANDEGDGSVLTYSAKGKDLVVLTSTSMGGAIETYQLNGKALLRLANAVGNSGGMIDVLNKTGESIAQMYADEYGNGVVYAGNRKGEGLMLQPGP